MRRGFWLIAFLGVAGLCVFLYRMERATEPAYNGKTLSAWLHQAYEQSPLDTNADARIAIHKIGTNAIPTLLRLVTIGDADYESRAKAHIGFAFLGSNADPAVPALVELMKKPGTGAMTSFYCLCSMPESPAVISEMHKLLTNGDRDLRDHALEVLKDIEDTELFAALTAASTNKDPVISSWAKRSLKSGL